MDNATEFKLDLKDRKILFELDKDARQSCSQIGKKVGLSPEVVNYRIKILEKEKIITQYQVVVNLSKLGIIEFKIALSLEHLTEEKLTTLLRKLEKINGIMWIASSKGNWDLIVSAEVGSLNEVNTLKSKVISLFSGNIRDKAVAICTNAEVYNRDYLLEKKQGGKRNRLLVNTSKKEKIDDLDKAILKELAENGRKPIIDISKKVKESERVVNYRIKQLVKREIITGFRIAIDYGKVGVNFYKTFFYLSNPEENRLKELNLYFSNNKNIIHNVEALGNWDSEPEFEVSSEKEFDAILADIKNKFSDIIQKVDILTISKEHKFVYL